MTNVNMSYFKANPEFSKSLFNDWQATQTHIRQMEKQLLDKYQATQVYGRGDFAAGLAVLLENDAEPSAKTGLAVTKQVFDKQYYAIYTPNKRFKEGKAFANELAKLNEAKRHAPNFSDFATAKLGCSKQVIGSHSGSRSGMALYNSVAGIAKGVLLLKIPHSEEDKTSLSDVSPELTEIKKSEFISLTEE